MTFDIRHALDGWEFDPEDVTVRSIEGEDGQEKIQLRLDLGILQMEISGRPDGKTIEGFTSWLDLYESQQKNHDEANPDGVPYQLDTEDCDRLLREGVQYYHRYISFWTMKRYELCARDTERNLRLFRFVREHAKLDRDKFQFDQWRPYVIMMHVRAVATPLEELDQFDAAISAVESGIRRIDQFLVDYGQEEHADKINELSFLKRWRRKLRKKNNQEEEPTDNGNEEDPVQSLETELAEAIEQEDYERAAALRDQLSRLENPPPPST